jgi:hypothetical protein
VRKSWGSRDERMDHKDRLTQWSVRAIQRKLRNKNDITLIGSEWVFILFLSSCSLSSRFIQGNIFTFLLYLFAFCTEVLLTLGQTICRLNLSDMSSNFSTIAVYLITDLWPTCRVKQVDIIESYFYAKFTMPTSGRSLVTAINQRATKISRIS